MIMPAVLLTLALATASSSEPVQVTVRVDPPAMWIADRITYAVQIACAPGFDIVAADLDRARLPLTGLELVTADSTRRDDGGALRYTFEYVVTTYRVDVATPAIGPMRVRYFRTGTGQRAQDAAPAGDVTVPGATMAFRSLLPDAEVGIATRPGADVPPRWWPYTVLGPFGVGMILLAIVPAALAVLGVARAARRRQRVERPQSSRQALKAAREALEESGRLDPRDPRSRRDGFVQLEAIVRTFLASAGDDLATLTPDEIDGGLAQAHPRIPWPLVKSVLESCETARFAAREALPSEDAWRQARSDAEAIVGGAPAGR